MAGSPLISRIGGAGGGAGFGAGSTGAGAGGRGVGCASGSSRRTSKIQPQPRWRAVQWSSECLVISKSRWSEWVARSSALSMLQSYIRASSNPLGARSVARLTLYFMTVERGCSRRASRSREAAKSSSGVGCSWSSFCERDRRRIHPEQHFAGTAPVVGFNRPPTFHHRSIGVALHKEDADHPVVVP